jgi:photosystem II stability/assembly factor-like uncharacterized protein
MIGRITAGLAAAVAPLAAQDQWTSLNTGSTASLTGISCPAAATCYAVGAGGAVLKTTNSGSSWSPQSSGTSQHLNGVHCVSTELCLAVGTGGTLRRTTDGGAVWTGIASEVSASLNGVHCAGTACVAVGEGGAITRSTNAGAAWSSVASGSTSHLYAVQFATADTVYAAGQLEVLKSVSAGGAWSANIATGIFAWGFYGMHFRSGSLGWVVGAANETYRTTSGGAPWQDQTPSVGGGIRTYEGAHFVSPSIGYIICREGYVYKITDGVTDLTPKTGVAGKGLYGIAFPDTLSGYVVGDSGVAYRVSRPLTPVALTSAPGIRKTPVRPMTPHRGGVQVRSERRVFDLRGSALPRESVLPEAGVPEKP